MVVVNFATNSFIKGQDRLKQSVEGKAHFLGLSNNYSTIKSPTHQESPYQFKIHAIEYAMQVFPDENTFLWADASMYVVGDLSKIEKIIEQDGYFMEEAGHYVSDWCNAHTRKHFNLQPHENYTMFSAGLLGLNKKSEIAMSFFKQWEAAALAGCFKGDWRDHRHDMTSGSIIAQRLGMKYQRGGSHMAYIGPGYGTPEKDVVFYLQGI